MAVSYSGHDAKAMERAITMLTNCATFQTLVGAANAAEAAASVVESGQESAATAPFALVSIVEADDPEETALMTYRHRGQIGIEVIAAQLGSPTTAAEEIRRLWGLGADIAAEIDAQRGSAGALARGHTRVDTPALGSETDQRRNEGSVGIMIEWRTT